MGTGSARGRGAGRSQDKAAQDCVVLDSDSDAENGAHCWSLEGGSGSISSTTSSEDAGSDIGNEHREGDEDDEDADFQNSSGIGTEHEPRKAKSLRTGSKTDTDDAQKLVPSKPSVDRTCFNPLPRLRSTPVLFG